MPLDAAAGIPSVDITLGLLAGGRGTRLGGVDKAWLQRGGTPQILRWRDRFSDEVSTLLVSANGDPARLAGMGFKAVPDRVADAGPLAGLDALAAACNTPWLLTVPVDLVDPGEGLLLQLAACRRADGAYAIDDDGMQPLVALWRTQSLRRAAADALASGNFAIRSLHATLDMAAVRFEGVRFGNLNTPEDLAASGAALPTR
ncbi:MAG: NTP transferase domain-containing protein [Luteimonas sp.]|nr:NTP transferase domain-containing protein [Luteimonas sp.]